MRITLEISDSHSEEFLTLVDSLGYASIVEDTKITLWQQQETARRLKKEAGGAMVVRPWSEAKEDIFR